MSTWKYDVFINFGAEDSCKDFAYRLNNGLKENGIHTYMYDRDLDRDTGDNDFREAFVESMIWILLNHLECSSLPDVFGIGVNLLKPYHDKFLVIFYTFSFPLRKKYETGFFGEALDINEAAYGAEVHKWKKAVLMDDCLDGCNIIDMTKEYQSSIDEIIKRLSKMIYEVSPGRRKGYELTCHLEERLAIYWDFNCSPFPTNVNPEDIAKTIIAFVKEIKTNWAAVDIYAYGHSSEEQQKKLRSSLAKQNVTLHHMGVTLIHTPRGRKDTTFFALLVDMLKRSHSFPEPSPIMLISANISYANALHALGLLGHKTMLVTSSEVGVSFPSINASVYTWSDVAKGTSSSEVQIKELPDDNNNWPGSNLVKREDLVATSSSQFEDFIRCKDFRSIDPCDIFFFIFWDFENCPIPGEVPTKDVAFNIENFVRGKIGYKLGYFIPRIRAYADFSDIHGEVRESLEKSGVKLINTPHVKKDAADEAMMIDLFMYSKLVRPPSSIMVITGDVDFATTLRAIGGIGHDIYLAIPSWVDVSESLINASKDYWYWSKVAKREDLVATLSSQFKELSLRCMKFVSIDTFDTYLFIFWDLENCPVPKEVPARDVLKNILKFVRGKIDWSSASIFAYADFSLIHGEVRESLEESGVKLINTPHVKKDAADEAMMIDLFMYSKLVRSPSSIMVITGDVDFATTLHALAGFGHDIYLAIPSRPRVDVSESLTSASKDYWYWSEVAYGIDLTGLKGQLVQLLERNGQLRLGSFVAEYQKIFKKPLRLSEYKARKLVNLLKRMSYMISVEVLNGETLVKLKGD